ncbi:hypothetical protein LCGC14_1923040 [marine sediment metagenome]|uniref:Uncharacterized protein n=1 Tax=marine sediment metagenome TaxID=412755 RepID=A0A0F9I446_9ZZZZ
MLQIHFMIGEYDIVCLFIISPDDDDPEWSIPFVLFNKRVWDTMG